MPDEILKLADDGCPHAGDVLPDFVVHQGEEWVNFDVKDEPEFADPEATAEQTRPPEWTFDVGGEG